MPISTRSTKDNDERYTPLEFMVQVAKANCLEKFTIDLATCDEAFQYQKDCFTDSPLLYTLSRPFDKLPDSYFFWCNPPYSQNPSFSTNLDRQLNRTNNFSSPGAVLVNSNTETSWFRTYAEKATAILFLSKRVQFLLPGLVQPRDSNGKLSGNQKAQTLFLYGTGWCMEKLPAGLLTRNYNV